PTEGCPAGVGRQVVSAGVLVSPSVDVVVLAQLCFDTYLVARMSQSSGSASASVSGSLHCGCAASFPDARARDERA
ncbi:MAG: hypothetical protein AAFY64_06560, partial [Pseudomonadota bacterium]